MSPGYDLLMTKPPQEWEFGYIFVDSTNNTGRPDLYVDRCEVCLKAGAAKLITFCQVSGISRSDRTYELSIFADHLGEKLLIEASIRYIDGFSYSILFDYSTWGTASPFNGMAEQMIKVLHSIIWERLIKLGPPKNNGIPILVWYYGFAKQQRDEIEYSSRVTLGDFIHCICA